MLGIAKEGAQFRRACSLAQFRREFYVSHVPRDGGERGEVLALGRRRNQEEKNEIHGFSIDRVEMDRPLEPREHTEETIESFDTGVRQGKPFAKSGGTEFLAGPQGSEDCLPIEVERRRGPRGEIEEQLLLVVRAGTENNAARIDKAGEIHGCPPARISRLV